jgi:hypothetical protein
MSFRYIRPPADPRGNGGVVESSISFWPIPEGTTPIDVEYCLRARWEVAEALRRAAASGVVEYHIGSRGLRRFDIKELRELYAFWSNAANDALTEGLGTAIQSRRATPCDV